MSLLPERRRDRPARHIQQMPGAGAKRQNGAGASARPALIYCNPWTGLIHTCQLVAKPQRDLVERPRRAPRPAPRPPPASGVRRGADVQQQRDLPPQGWSHDDTRRGEPAITLKQRPFRPTSC